MFITSVYEGTIWWTLTR